MANLGKIKLLMEKKNVKVNELCGKLNITRQQLNHIIKSNSTSIETLENISKELNVPVGYFFDEVTEAKSDKIKPKVVIQIEVQETEQEKILQMVLGKEFINFLNK